MTSQLNTLAAQTGAVAPRQMVLNDSYGAFMLSHDAVLLYAQLKGLKLYFGEDNGLVRHYYRVPEAEYQALVARDPQQADAAYFADNLIDRCDAVLVQVVRELGAGAHRNGKGLQIVDVPAAPTGFAYAIENNDGLESIILVAVTEETLRPFVTWNETAQHGRELDASSHEDAVARYRAAFGIQGYACIKTSDAEVFFSRREGQVHRIHHSYGSEGEAQQPA